MQEEGWESGERAAAAGGCVAVYLRLQGRLSRCSGVAECGRYVSQRRRRFAAAADHVTSACDPTPRRPAAHHWWSGAPGRGSSGGRSEATYPRRPMSPGGAVRLGLLLMLVSLLRIAECCSSRANPRPRSPSPSTRRPYTFQTQPCPAMYQEHYCLNGATCFKVNIGHSPLYNCECADGFMGQRCEFKDLDGSYSRPRDAILETASIAGGAGVALLVCVLLTGLLYVWSKRRSKNNACSQQQSLSVRFDMRLPPASHVVQIPANHGTPSADVIQMQCADRWTSPPAANQELVAITPLHKAASSPASSPAPERSTGNRTDHSDHADHAQERSMFETTAPSDRPHSHQPP